MKKNRKMRKLLAIRAKNTTRLLVADRKNLDCVLDTVLKKFIGVNNGN